MPSVPLHQFTEKFGSGKLCLRVEMPPYCRTHLITSSPSALDRHLELGRCRGKALNWLALWAIFGSYWFFWTAVQPTGEFFSRGPAGYYGLLTAGFRDGHLHVKLNPAPGLLALSDPYDPVANAPYRAHDMTLWQGKYYLYYGVTPALTIFLPVSVLTGWYPTEAWVVAFFCSVGVITGLALLTAVRRRYFPLAPTWTLALAGAVLTLASPVVLLNEAVQFYQVPIACAFALHMLMLGAIFRAVSVRRGAVVWLAVASVLYGLSIGARPNYLLSGGALAVSWMVLIWRERSRGGWRSAVQLGLAAFGPAVVAGVGLLLYNWLRFGVPTEFGMQYTLGGERIPDLKLMGLEYVWPHLGDYLLKAGNWGRYFPFFLAPVGVPHGALRYAPWLWLIPAALVLRGSGPRLGRAALIWAVAVATGANLALLSVFFGLTDRYPPDFVPAALVLAGFGALALGERVRAMRLARIVGGALAGVTIFFSLAVWMKRFPEQDRLLPLARLANTPISWWEQWRGETPGGLRLQLELPSGREGLSEPLVHTGVSPDGRDWLQIDYLAGGRARLGFFHAGLGFLHGREFVIPGNRRLTVELECGALLPPAAHPMYATWSAAEQMMASRDLRARVNGEEVLTAAVSCYESTPEDRQVGNMRWGSGGLQPAFTGKIAAVEKIPVRRPELVSPGLGERAPMELKLWFPADKAAGRDPLVTTGSGGDFDVLYCEYAGVGRMAFGLYHRGYDTVSSPILEFDPMVPHTLQVWMGSLAQPGAKDAADVALPTAQRLTVVLDGKVALNQEQGFYPAQPSTVVFGKNSLVRNVVGPIFNGRLESVKPMSFEALPDPGLQRHYGAVDMMVTFSRGIQGAAEPLVVTGVEGAGNFIYVRYLEGDKMVFGFDHWGIGGLVGEPVAVDTWRAHRLRITMGSLYPPGEDVGEWRSRVQVKLDDTVVLDGNYAVHPSTRMQVRIGENAIGGSTCGPRFSGQIQKIERPARPEK